MTARNIPLARQPNAMSPRAALMWTIGLVVAVLALVLLFMGWRNIRPGYVGIVFDKANHTVQSRALEPGWTVINPFTQAIQEYPITIQTYVMVQKSSEGQTGGDDSVKVQSVEGQQVNLDVAIQYKVEKERAGQLYQEWGGAPIEVIQNNFVRQNTRSIVPIVAAQYGWEEINSAKRAEISTKVSEELTKQLEQRHLTLVSFYVREVHLPANLQNVLAAKITAQQQAEQQKYQLQQAQVKAEQDRVVAEGQANAVKAQAEGEAQATLTRAQAQAQANELLAKSVTEPLIRYQQMQRWDGKLPVFQGRTNAPLINTTDMISASRSAGQ